MASAPAYTPLTEEDRLLIAQLRRVTFLPGSPDKGFARWLFGAVSVVDPTMTESQRSYLRRLVHRYRRQIGRGS